MTEAELLNLFFNLESSNYTLGAGVGSVTVALYTLSYMIGTKLQIRSIIFVILTYCAIIAFLAFINSGYLEVQAGIIKNLRDLQFDGTQLSYASEILMDRWPEENSSTDPILLIFQILLLLFPTGGIAYLIHQYRKSDAQKEND